MTLSKAALMPYDGKYPLPVEAYNSDSKKWSSQELPLETDTYAPGDNLKRAVNLALRLGRPLLLMGKQGSGKTMLAASVALCLDRPYFAFTVKSTSKVSDTLYTYDAIKELYDLEMYKITHEVNKTINQYDKYVTYGAIGQALKGSQDRKKVKPAILLIDEIDKANIDFPNDLLEELDKGQFYVPELNETFPAKKPEPDEKPLIIITCNNERVLSPAFMRRCLLHTMEPPKPDALKKIAANWLQATWKRLVKDHPLEQTKAAEYAKSAVDQAEARYGENNIITSQVLDCVIALAYGFSIEEATENIYGPKDAVK